MTVCTALFGLDPLGDVGRHGEGGAARGLDLGDQRREPILAAGDHRDGRAEFSELLRRRFTDATAGTRHDRDGPGQLVLHGAADDHALLEFTARSRLMFQVNAPSPELAWPYLCVPRQGPSTRAEAA